MLPVDTRIWGHRVPGYIPESDDEDEDSEEEEFLTIAQERADAVVRTLGSRWTTTPMVEFDTAPLDELLDGPAELKLNPPAQNLSFRQQPPSFRVSVHAPIVTKTFAANGMVPASNNNDWSVHWSGPGMRDATYQNMNEFQRVNHFPGSTELTRKDRLWAHFNEMKQAFGDTFDFIPESFVLPDQVEKFLDCYERTNYTWIVKPSNSAQGKGIFLLTNLEELPLEEHSVVSQYVDNPLLIQGLKFDLRLYVLVTSYTPLRAYIYREGLVRFASSPYSMDPAHIQDAYRHLTNYSVNKTAINFMENQELENDNVGHKWSLSALNKHLKCVGIDCDLMWARINDLVVKTLLSVEPSIATRTRNVTVHNNCFEVYGFDVLVDSKLKPWLLEVNLSPSMTASSPLDWRVKSTLLSDVFNLVGICSPNKQTLDASRLKTRILQVRQATCRNAEMTAKQNCTSRKGTAEARCAPEVLGRRPVTLDRLTEEQLKMLAQALQEVKRCRNFVRLHPTRATCERYQPIWDARGSAQAICDFFRLQQSTPMKILASVMFGLPPVGMAVGDRRLSRFKWPLGSYGGHDPREFREPESPKYKTTQSNDSGTTKAPSDDGIVADRESDSEEDTTIATATVVIDKSIMKDEGMKAQEKTRPLQLKPFNHAFRRADEAVVSDVRESRPSSNETVTAGDESPPPAQAATGLRPPMPRPPHATGQNSFRAAARASMQQVPRTEPPSRPPNPHRSQSTPALPKLLPEATPPYRIRQNSGQWTPAEFQRGSYAPPVHTEIDTRAPTALAVKAMRGPYTSIEAMVANLNLDIEL